MSLQKLQGSSKIVKPNSDSNQPPGISRNPHTQGSTQPSQAKHTSKQDSEMDIILASISGGQKRPHE